MKGPFTVEEEKKLVELISIHGKKWKLISQHFRCRSENQLKNKWNSVNRRKKLIQPNGKRTKFGQAPSSSPLAAYIQELRLEKQRNEHLKLLHFQNENNNTRRTPEASRIKNTSSSLSI